MGRLVLALLLVMDVIVVWLCFPFYTLELMVPYYSL